MASAPETGPEGVSDDPRPARWGLKILAALLLALLVAGLAGWFTREEIATSVIDDLLADYDIPASYEIVSIGPDKQVLANIVVGDPARPDLVIERAVIGIDYSFGLPAVGSVSLLRPRLYGSFRDGDLSFGALDPLLEGEGEPGLPAIDLDLIDGRARIATEYGEIGIKAAGAGRLDDGFAGVLAANAPGIGIEDCRAAGATLYGKVTTQAGAPSFDGPVRLRDFSCEGASLERADIAATLSLPRSLDAVEGEFNLVAKALSGAGVLAEDVTGTGRFAWNEGVFNLRHDLTASAVDAGYARIATLEADGALRSTGNFARSEWDAQIGGEGLAVDALEGDRLKALGKSVEDTLLAPLLAKFARNFAVASEGGALRADLTVRQEAGGALSLTVPEALLSSGSGETILAASRVSWSEGALRGNLMTGGAGLPRITGRMEQAGGANRELVFRLAMAPYEASAARLAVPRFELRQREGELAFAGLVKASGPIPGGRVENLRLPLSGTYDRGALAIGRGCTTIAFDRLVTADLALERESMALCPHEAPAMLTYDDRLSVAITSKDIALGGKLGESPLALGAARLVMTYPGGFAFDDIDVAIGAEDAAVRLSAAALTGEIGAQIAGEFAGGTASIGAVPLDLAALSGAWFYKDGALRVERGAFLLSERIDGEARFEPLAARDAVLTFEDGAILAEADLRHPASDSLVTRVAIRHDLETARGRAVLDVPGVVFGDALAPDDLTYLAKGVVAEVEGTVRGEGLIEWDGDDVTSSGRFATDDIDLAAAFGPLTGLAGEIVFTDLLALTTAPGQVVKIETINPGVEVLGGRVVFALTEGQVVSVEDARWPFMGGTLVMLPVELDYGSAEAKAYVFEITGLEAARFIAEMELTNLSATGIFDGVVPIVFDADGNGRIENGLLTSRPPGGNVAYVGELTYEDMGAMANFAFQSLRSLDYSRMAVALEGSLAGEIITRFTFDGVSQGEGASRNFVTRRLANLPIRFKVNVRSENFHQLATMVRSFWDPQFLGNPVDRGILRAEDGRFAPRAPSPPPGTAEEPSAEAIRPEDTSVQLPESEESL